MKEKTPSVRRVAMAKRVAQTWLDAHTEPEYRLTVYRGSTRESHHLPGLLRSSRDGRIRFANTEAVPDLGIREAFDSITVWSKDKDRLQGLEAALQKMGCETTGVF
jgi:hypothetical protein